MIANASPRVGCASLMPWRAIAPSTVKAAASSDTASGIFAHRFEGTHTISACRPFDATRSPTLNPLTPSPTSITTPALQYPSDGLIELSPHGFDGREQAVRAD